MGSFSLTHTHHRDRCSWPNSPPFTAYWGSLAIPTACQKRQTSALFQSVRAAIHGVFQIELGRSHPMPLEYLQKAFSLAGLHEMLKYENAGRDEHPKNTYATERMAKQINRYFANFFLGLYVAACSQKCSGTVPGSFRASQQRASKGL